MLAGILTYTLTGWTQHPKLTYILTRVAGGKREFLVWRKVQKGTFKNNTFVIRHHEFSTQVLLMTRSWNQTKNSSNLRYIATGYLRTYKSRNLNEAIATVRIGRDINIYIHMYIYKHHWNCTRITVRKPSFSSAKLRHGEFKFHQTEWTDGHYSLSHTSFGFLLWSIQTLSFIPKR